MHAIQSTCMHVYMRTCSVSQAEFDFLQPHGLWPARVLYPWDSPSKNTGVGCHFLLPRIFPTQRFEPTSLMTSALAGGFFTTEPPRKHPPPILFFGKEKFQKLFSSPSPMMGKCFHLKKVGHYSFFRDNTWKSCGRSWSMVFSTEAVIGGRYPMGYVSKTPGRGWPHIGRPSRQAGDLNFSLDDTCWNPSLSWVIWPPPPHP